MYKVTSQVLGGSQVLVTGLFSGTNHGGQGIIAARYNEARGVRFKVEGGGVRQRPERLII